MSFERRSPSATVLELDAIAFDIDRVEVEVGRRFRAAPHEYDGESISIDVGPKSKTGRVRVAYKARPRRGLYFLAPDDAVPTRPRQVWSQCQDEDARHWFPCHDKPHLKMTTELSVKVASGLVALSNGELVSKDQPRGKNKLWTYRFRMGDPMPSYLVTLVVGDFEILEDRSVKAGKSGVPIAYYFPPGRKADAKRSFRDTPSMVELFGRLTGVPFPWSRYSQIVVSDFIFGGMENTTATTLYEHILLDERAALDISSHDLIAHELAHQWFGDYVTCRDWSHAWLNEGFATYFEHVEREHRLSRDEYEYGIAGDEASYRAEANGRYMRPIVCRDYREPLDLFDRHLYEKGGLVLHMLRAHLGDDLFWKGVNRYLTSHAYGIVETNDLMRAFEIESGESLEHFFDQWVFRPGHPVLRVKVSWEKDHLNVSLEQTQKGTDVPVFSLPIVARVIDASGRASSSQKQMTKRHDTLVIPCAKRPKWVEFDPDFLVVGDISVDAPTDMLIAQLSAGSTARIRWVAADALKKRNDLRTVDALGSVLKKEDETWMVQAEAARVLGKIGGQEAFGYLEQSVEASHPKVRRAVVRALGEFRSKNAMRLVARAAKKDKSYLVEAEASRALGRTRQKESLRVLRQVVDNPSWADVKRAAALDGFGALRDESALPDVMQRTLYGIPTPGRRAAISALPLLGEGRKIREHLQLLLDDGDPYLRITVVHALETLGDSRARAALRRRLDRELDGRVVRRINEALRNLAATGAGEKTRMADEMEELRREVRDLKLRLQRVEDTSNKKKAARHK